MFFEAIFAIGTIVITEFVRHAVEEVYHHWKNFRNSRNASNQHTNSAYSNRTTKDVTQELEVVDAEVVELERKAQRDGVASQHDQERKQELELLRTEKYQEYQELKAAEIAEDQCASPEDYETSVLDGSRVHLLQFHMGQAVLKKKCSCGKPMILQSKCKPHGSLYQLSDFFWACTGFYNDSPLKCKKTQNFTAKDVGFLHKSDILEFQISNNDLSRIFHQPPVEKVVIDRIHSHLRQKDDEVLCPVHHVPMVLREKREHQGVVLDMFFLACPHTNCQQIVKLKSPAQLAAYLKRREGRGIL